MIGAGRGSDGGPDASICRNNIWRQGDIRFIGSTTYEGGITVMARSTGHRASFQQIDIKGNLPPGGAIKILEGLRYKYNKFTMQPIARTPWNMPSVPGQIYQQPLSARQRPSTLMDGGCLSGSASGRISPALLCYQVYHPAKILIKGLQD